MEGCGKLAYSYGGVEPRKFGLGLVAGLLLVSCAYFSTAKFDAVHIIMSKQSIKPQAVSSRAKNAAGIGSLANAVDSSKQKLDSGLKDQGAWSSEGSKAEVLEEDDVDGDISSFGQGPVSSPEEKKTKDETFARNGDGAGVAVLLAAPPDPAEEGGKDEVGEKDDDPSAVDAALPPLSSDSSDSDSTQESGVLEDEELQVQNAIAAAANPPKESNSISSNYNGSSSAPADIPVRPTSPETVPPSPNQISATSSEVKAPPFQMSPPIPEVKQMTPPIPEVKQTDLEAPLREWKPLCDVTSNYRIDWCDLEGDVRVVGSNGSVTLVGPAGHNHGIFHEESWLIKPYPRKADPNAMRSVRAVTVRSVSATTTADACTETHGSVPALVFSVRGYTGNYFHAYTDVLLPLFLTARRYSGEVVLLVTGFQAWWVGKFAPVFRGLSNYAPVDLDADDPRRVRCFRHVQVGLTSHSDFSIDPTRAPNGYSMLDFTAFMRSVYALPRHVALAPVSRPDRRHGQRRPRLLVIARARTRRFVNAEEIVRGARRVGFEVVVSEGGGTQEVGAFAELVNSCDAMVGVHGAGLTNMVFLPTGGVVVQVLPLGPLEFVAGYFRGPARDMGLRYLEYRIAPGESTLVEQYPRDHPVLTDPMSLSAKAKDDWVAFMGVYLFKQDVRVDMKRFRPVLKKALARLRANKAKNNTNN